MLIFKTKSGILSYLKKNRDKSIGFVPTMGAIHEGHLSLLEKSKSQNEITICSIFVNPTQFNNTEDFEKYPRTLDNDILLLDQNECQVLFAPEVNEMYTSGESEIIDFESPLFDILEGEFRPGHFAGVVTIVKKFLDIIRPTRAYFGLKDYQQFLVINEMVDHYEMPIILVPCPIVRQTNGLALSSRNARLDEHQLGVAPEIYRTLKWVKENVDGENMNKILRQAIKKLNSLPEVKVEYLELRNSRDLSPVEIVETDKEYILLAAVFVGKIRLIDNLLVG
jgi:pantoate--beta-alanine ligase